MVRPEPADIREVTLWSPRGESSDRHVIVVVIVVVVVVGGGGSGGDGDVVVGGSVWTV